MDFFKKRQVRNLAHKFINVLAIVDMYNEQLRMEIGEVNRNRFLSPEEKILHVKEIRNKIEANLGLQKSLCEISDELFHIKLEKKE